MENQKIALKNFTEEELKEFMKEIGEKPFRGTQIYSWIYKGAKTFDDMKNIPKSLREKLEKVSYIGNLETELVLKSKVDKTKKYLFALNDGNIIESVMMDYDDRVTACISNQVGCRMGCKFCASTMEGLIRNLEEAKSEAKKIGYPVMIKASLGGGGKGIRVVLNENELENAYFTAKAEAKNNFNDDSVYMEKFIENPRHIEVQILGDAFGNVIHLYERDCTIQRRNQKVLEEAPSIILNDELRNKMGTAAVNAAKAVNYESAGTIEFLLDKHGDFYFMEMNTRIQVEHPVTEMVTSVDIVKEQLNIANGMELSLTQDNIKIDGHSIECRINAENPKLGFAPSPGKIKFLNLPGGNGVRVDTAVYNGYTIPPNYDSMIAKLIVHGKSRDEAIKKMLRALDEFVIEGINTNIEFQISILKNQAFRLGTYDTSFISKEFKL